VVIHFYSRRILPEFAKLIKFDSFKSKANSSLAVKLYVIFKNQFNLYFLNHKSSWTAGLTPLPAIGWFVTVFNLLAFPHVWKYSSTEYGLICNI